MTKRGNIDYRVDDIKSDVLDLQSDVKTILSNHLPHLQIAVTELNGKISGLATKINVLSAINIGAIIIGILIAKYL